MCEPQLPSKRAALINVINANFPKGQKKEP